MKKIIQEFRTFAMRGNVIDMAIGIIVGASFGKIVTSLVNDIIMPPIGLLIGGVNFRDLSIVIKKASLTNAAVTINYGNFVQVIFDFIIVAFAVFLMIKLINTAKKKQEETSIAAPIPPKQEELLAEIRDLLKK
jgi:large conductance mechanosensitive channel